MFRATPEAGIVWITGASSGIGRAVARELARRGFTVAATARRAEALAELAAEEPRIHAFAGDVTDVARMAALPGEIEAQLGPIALAVLNAGVYDQAERRGFDVAVVRNTLDTNLGGTVNCLGPVLAAMCARGRGQIALTASLAGYGGIPGSLAYGASKAAMIYMAETLKLTYAPQGLTIQVVNPGFVATNMTSGNTSYDMPFLMQVEDAARRICDGFARGGFEIAFPRRLAYTFKLVRLLPYPALFAVMGRATRRVLR
jgi:NAD(P)-dependent dehydrogenase (short-subunit alcohol dehydrogenase family)